MFKKLLSIFEKRKDILKNVYDLYIFITLKDDKNISIWKNHDFEVWNSVILITFLFKIY